MSETPAQSLRRALAEAGIEVTTAAIEGGAKDAVQRVGRCPLCGADTRYGVCLTDHSVTPA